MLIVVSSVSLVRVVFGVGLPGCPCLRFFVVFPKSLWAYGFALGGGCGRQGTSEVHPRVYYGDMDLGI